MKRYLFSLAFLLASLGMAGYGLGMDLSGLQPPAPYGVFSTLSADSPPKGQAAIALRAERSIEPEFWRFSPNIAYGLTDNIELSASFPYLENSDSGIEDIAFGFKHRFFDEGRYGPSIAYIIMATLGSGGEGQTTGGSVGGGIALSKRVGPANGHLNLLYSMPGNDDLENAFRFSGGIVFSAAHDFQILAELFGMKSHFSEEVDQLEARLGYRFIAAEDIYTTVGIGMDLKDRAPEYRFMLSVSLTLPRKEKAIERIYE
ncbi:MAG: hypothetical protein Kow0025_16450 [Thermodesulfovibrionales bacterium]